MPPFSESTFFCFSQFGCSCIKRPIDDYVLGPYVELDFSGQDGSVLKVGNKSNPPNNTACIKSFQYGQSDGVGAEVEIYDEEGGSFQRFVDKIVRTPGDALKLYKAKGKWGWIMQNCDGTTRTVLSRDHWFAILSVDINFAGKGIIFKLELQDLMEPLFETRINKSYDGLTLKEAIRQMFKEATPPINDVRFLRAKSASASAATLCQTGSDSDANSGTFDSGDLEELKFNGDAETRTAKWQCNNQTPLAAAREWVSRYRSERDDKGVIVFYDNKTSNPTLIFLEDPLPKCFTNDDQCSKSIGTYIVNGGKHSPVLSFDPKIKFNFSAAARSGAAVSSQSGKAEIQRGQPCPPGVGGAVSGSGSASMIQVTEDMNRLYGPDEAAKEGNLSQAGNERANKTFENIEAELRIQGEPRLDDPFTIRIRTVSIIVINPFHLAQGTGKDSCPDWLVRPPCNPILSNKNWFMNGVSHEIKEGSYTTTIKLFLPAPGTSSA